MVHHLLFCYKSLQGELHLQLRDTQIEEQGRHHKHNAQESIQQPASFPSERPYHRLCIPALEEPVCIKDGHRKCNSTRYHQYRLQQIVCEHQPMQNLSHSEESSPAP